MAENAHEIRRLVKTEEGYVMDVTMKGGSVKFCPFRDNGAAVYRNDVVELTAWPLERPQDVSFAPNSHIVVTDIGDNTIKIYNYARPNHPTLVRKLILAKQTTEVKMIDASDEVTVELQQPFNTEIGPGPEYQLWAMWADGTFLINVDWDEKPVVFEKIRQIINAEEQVCNLSSFVGDHHQKHKFVGSNGHGPLHDTTKAQFCEMFYHVTQSLNNSSVHFKCLDERCKVSQANMYKYMYKYAKSVVLYVRVTDGAGLSYHARYGNCYQGTTRDAIHAEAFMLEDSEFRHAVTALRRGGNRKEIDLYMNKQPCYKSSGKKTRVCAEEMAEFYKKTCKPGNIRLTIYLCQIDKIDWDLQNADESTKIDIENAIEGVKKMMSAGIVLQSMTEKSWELLAKQLKPNIFELDSRYWSQRKALDDHIKQVLLSIRQQVEQQQQEEREQEELPDQLFSLSLKPGRTRQKTP